LNLLLDTHLLLWAALDDPLLPGAARDVILDPGNGLAFSAASIWEVAIKVATGRGAMLPDPDRLRRRLLESGYAEVPITAEHGIATMRLPLLHRDPFNRIMLAQAQVEGLVLLTVDRILASYPGPVRLLG
jgi:PIN domain nuclease of toxin-antitoxin system